MTMRQPYKVPMKAARAAHRAIMTRIRRGYDALAYAEVAKDGLNKGRSVLHVEIYTTPKTETRRSDKDRYTFEIACDSFSVAGEAAQIFKKSFHAETKVKKTKEPKAES